MRDTDRPGALCYRVTPELYLGYARGRQGRTAEAAACFRAALALDPASAGAHYNLGTALEGIGRMTEAIAQYREAATLQPHFAEAESALTRAATAIGPRERATSK